MRRSFKAATVFTGMAALTVGLGPAALAATTKPAATDAITTRECGANTGGVSKWAHLFYPNNDHPAECTHGGPGWYAATGTITAFCPGTVEFGYGGYLTTTGSWVSGVFSPANNERVYFSKLYGSPGANLDLVSVYVDDTGGTQKCTS